MRSIADTINSYVTDMLSLEEHIDKAIKGQIEDLKGYPEVVAELQMAQRWVRHHMEDLKQLKETRGGATATEAIKRAGSSILGLAAGAIDLVRNEGLPKNLRDDYTRLVWRGSATRCSTPQRSRWETRKWPSSPTSISATTPRQ
jgi:hypothetical protein